MAIEFVLGQYYPIPFQLTTAITIYLPYKSHVSLKVFDKTVWVLAVIAEGDFALGEHKVIFDVGFLPNGIYYCTLTSGIYTQTRALAVIG